MSHAIGKPIARIDGLAKVTGQVRYGMDAAVSGAVHAHLVTSTVARGRVLEIDATEAERAPGLVAVITAANVPRLPYGGAGGEELRIFVDPGAGRHLRLLQDDLVRFQGQVVAIAVNSVDTRSVAFDRTTRRHYRF